MQQLLTVGQASELLNVSESRVYALVREHRLPGVVRIGRTLRVDPVVLQQYIASGGQALAGGWRREATADVADR
jgi:excisionase family DNA binding protein